MHSNGIVSSSLRQSRPGINLRACCGDKDRDVKDDVVVVEYSVQGIDDKSSRRKASTLVKMKLSVELMTREVARSATGSMTIVFVVKSMTKLVPQRTST